MGRKITWILAIIMIFSILPVSADADAANSEKYAEAVDVVTSMGFMETNPETGFDGEAYITRGDAAALLVRLAGYEAAATSSFADVSDKHWANGYIKIAAENKLLLAYSDGNFYLNENMKAVDFAYGLLVMMGYEFQAEAQGGYPSGYYKTAGSIGLLDGVAAPAEKYITRYEIAQMLYNSFQIEVYETDTFGANSSANKVEDSSILSKYHNIYYARGIVTATSMITINKEATLDDGKIEIDGQIYNEGNIDCDGFAGRNVSYYYRYDETNDVYTIVYMKEYKNKVIEIADNDIYSKTTLTTVFYEEEGKSRSAKLEANGNLIYNNRFLCKIANADVEKLKVKNGRMVLVDNDNDNYYENCFIYEYETGIVDSVDLRKTTIGLKCNAKALDLQEVTYRIIKNSKPIKIEELISGDVIIIAKSQKYNESPENSCVEIIVCDKTVTGSVVMMDDEEITISAKEGSAIYPLSSKFVSEDILQLTVGFYGQFYIDSNGKVCSASKGVKQEKQFGYMLRAVCDEFENTLIVKLLTSSGEVKTFEAEERVSVDGEKLYGEEAYTKLRIASAIPEPESIKMMVRYSLSPGGKINYIDTILKNGSYDPDELVKDTPAIPDNGLRYQSMGRLLVSYSNNTRFFISDETIVFIVPNAAKSDKEYQTIAGASYFTNQQYYGSKASHVELEMYNVKDITPKVIVQRTDEAVNDLNGLLPEDATAGVVVKKKTTIDEDNEPYTSVLVNVQGNVQELKFTEDSKIYTYDDKAQLQTGNGGHEFNISDDISFGDMITWMGSSSGSVRYLFKYNKKSLYDMPESEYNVQGRSGYNEWISGAVENRKENLIGINISGADDLLYISAQSNPPVHICYQDGREVLQGSVSDIRRGDKIFACVRFGNVRAIAIYR